MFRFILLLSAFIYTILYTHNTSAHQLEDYLLTPPQFIQIDTASTSITRESIESIYNLIKATEFKGVKGDFSIHQFKQKKRIYFSFNTNAEELKDQAYQLQIHSDSILLTGNNDAALFYGKQTLLQLLEYALSEKAALPKLEISDWPNFEKRGYMLDISRDKVPTMNSLYQLIDLLASFKINELQLYVEHTFAYKNHQEVWENASPLTADEIQQLDQYCALRFIDLVPNQNSFGHMENWLKHDTYLDLAECPTDCKTKWGKRERTSLNPLNPKSFELMQELYAEYLPNFSSKTFNIGGDETIELCEGKSKAECKKLGKGKVYLNYIKQLNAEVNKHGKKSQFWGDIILNHPELIKEIPQNMTALVWGYDDVYPFDKNLPKFKQAGLDFYVCPGTSTWRSEIGRNTNAFENLRQAALEGKRNGAKGYLNTNWGDYGHFQPLSVVYPTLLVGASYSWNYKENTTEKLPFLLSHYVFEDETGNFAKGILKLGDAYLKANIPNGNSSAFHLMLRRYKWTMKGQFQTKKMTINGLEAAKQEINDALSVLEQSTPKSWDKEVLFSETKQAAKLAIHGANLGIERLKVKDQSTKAISTANKEKLIAELKPLIEKHKKIWIIRNRPGGLADSASKLEELLEYYQSAK